MIWRSRQKLDRASLVSVRLTLQKYAAAPTVLLTPIKFFTHVPPGKLSSDLIVSTIAKLRTAVGFYNFNNGLDCDSNYYYLAPVAGMGNSLADRQTDRTSSTCRG